MKTFLNALFPTLAFICLISLRSYSQTPLNTDSIAVTWDRLPGPSAYISKYAQGNGKLYAASEEALFISEDGGQNWVYNESLGRRTIKKLFANNQVVVVITQEPRALTPDQPFSWVEVHQILRSLDGGQTWENVYFLYQEPESPHLNEASEIMSANDSTLAFDYTYYQSNLLSPFSKICISHDYGATWSEQNYGATLLQSSRDTFAYVQSANNQMVGLISGHENLNLKQEVILAGAGATGTNIKKVVYNNGYFYLFKSDKTLWRSSDLGNSWQFKNLPFNGTFETVIWADSTFFLLSSTGVYQTRMNNLPVLIKIYDGEFGLAKQPKTLSPTHLGIWINSSQNQTIFSDNWVLNWEVRSHGLSSKVGQVSSICNQIFARSLGFGFNKGGWYLSDTSGENWDLLTASNFYQYDSYLDLYLGEYDGYAYRYIPATVQRSSDCGQTWENLNVGVSAAPLGLLKHNGRLFLYTQLDVKLLYSDNDGLTWEWGTVPETGISSMLSAGNTLIAFYRDKCYFSEDLGISWQERSLPVIMDKMIARNQILIGLVNPNTDSDVYVYRSQDLGLTWTIIAELPSMGFGTTRIVLEDENLLLLHFDNALFASGDDGENWTKITGIPFSKRISSSIGLGYATYSFIPQASRYYSDNGYLYAASESQGLWRIAADSILSHIKRSVSTYTAGTPDPDRWQIFPNPSAQEAWISGPSLLLEPDMQVTIRIRDAACQIQRTYEAPFNETGIRIDLNGLPNGVYFVEIETGHSTSIKQVVKI